ncbi:MAG: radical SAM protein [Armatimonadetes bacterium]|nr:radical SAM protein [Armatimonadota bacterium]
MALQQSLFDEAELETTDRGLGGREIRLVQSKSIVRPGTGRLACYDWVLNPYRGCAFGCSYCYAAAFVADAQDRADWGQWVEVKQNALRLLKRTPGLAGKTIFLGSATDPYQPIEQSMEITRSILDFLSTLPQQPSVLVQTRSPLALRDLEVFKRFQRLRVNISITTDDEEIRRLFEPSCASIHRRMDAVRELSAAGIQTGVCVSPMLPVRDPASFALRLKSLGACRSAISWFHLGTRPFSSGTRELGRNLLWAKDWTEEQSKKAAKAMRHEVPSFAKSDAFDPTW